MNTRVKVLTVAEYQKVNFLRYYQNSFHLQNVTSGRMKQLRVEILKYHTASLVHNVGWKILTFVRLNRLNPLNRNERSRPFSLNHCGPSPTPPGSPATPQELSQHQSSVSNHGKSPGTTNQATREPSAAPFRMASLRQNFHNQMNHKSEPTHTEAGVEGDSRPCESFGTIRYGLDNTDGEHFQQNGLGSVCSCGGGPLVFEGGREALMWVASPSL